MAFEPFYIVGAVGVVLGWLLMRDNSPYSRRGGPLYEKKGKRRFFGKLFYIVGFVSLTFGGLVQIFLILQLSK